MHSCRICVVGSTNIDMSIRTSRMPVGGETIAGQSMLIGQGGKGANQAVAASRLGAQVSFISRVGSDPFGSDSIAHMEREGIDTAFMIRDSNHPTGTAVIFVDDCGENCIVIVAGANGQLSSSDVRVAASAIKNSNIVLCQLETPLESTVEAFRRARAAGVVTILTPAPAIELPDEVLQLSDVCIPNRTELEHLTQRRVVDFESARQAADQLRLRGVKSVVVTMGSEGALLLDDTGATHIPATKACVVDTTGAGDAFTAALAVGLGEGYSLRDSARRASKVAALSVSKLGTQTSFPDRNEVDAI